MWIVDHLWNATNTAEDKDTENEANILTVILTVWSTILYALDRAN